jgi:hypothetical protein
MKRTTVRHEKQQALLKYEDQKGEIKRLLQQIKTGLEEHDRNASLEGGHHWGHVGDLNRIESELRDIRDRLMSEGEYAKQVRTHRTFNRHGERVEVSIPS